MLDDNFLVLLRPDAKNPANIKGTIHTKVKLKQIIETSIDKKDPRVIIIAIMSD